MAKKINLVVNNRLYTGMELVYIEMMDGWIRIVFESDKNREEQIQVDLNEIEKGFLEEKYQDFLVELIERWDDYKTSTVNDHFIINEVHICINVMMSK